MRSPIAALTWEIWRSSRGSFRAVAGTITLCALVSMFAPDKKRALESLEAVYISLMSCTFLLVFGIFHYAEFNPRKSWHGFPYRLFTLPVPTWLLVGIPMVLGLISVELVYLAWAKLVFAPLGKSITFWPAASLGSGIICFQALVWSLAGFRITRIIALGFAGIFFLQLAILPFASELFHQNQSEVVTILSFLFPALTLAAFLGGWFSVERQRHGGGRGRGWLKAQISQLIDALPRRRKNFTSPAAAHFWFEWRRSGQLLPIGVGAMLLFIFLPVSLLTPIKLISTFWILGWVLALPIIFATTIGIGFAKPDFWSSDMALSSFLAVRPLATGEIVATKMKVAALSVLLAWLQVFAFLALWLPLWAYTSDLKEFWETLVVIHSTPGLCIIVALLLMLLMLLSWRGMVTSFWIGLAGSRNYLIVANVLYGIAFGCSVSAVMFFIDQFNSKKLEHYIFWISAALTVAVLLKLWLAAFSWKNITPSRTHKYMLIWTLGSGGLVILALLVCPDIFWLKHLFILAALLPFPLARLGIAPLSLAKNRHRP